MPPSTLLLTGADVRSLLSLKECIDAVEVAMGSHGLGLAPAPRVLGYHVTHGGFHVKAGALAEERSRFAAKVNANFPENPRRFGLPTIQGVVLLFDALNGSVLAIMDSMEITRLRTAAASAVAAKHLARADARTVTICGCGVQGRAHVEAMMLVRGLERVRLYDVDAGRAERLCGELASSFRVSLEVVRDLAAAARTSDIVVTCTPARAPLLAAGDVSPGAFIAAVGADHPEKQEIAPALLASASIVTDVTDQAATMGDLHHAIACGALTRGAVHAELGEVLAGRRPGRRTEDEIIVFDSTGMALQDVAAAALVYEGALQGGRGTTFRFA